MPRSICNRCHRPEKVCICEFITHVNNAVEVGVLQHPTEVNQIKGTAVIAKLALSHAQLWVAEDIDQANGFAEWLHDGRDTYLLYPTDERQSVKTLDATELANNRKPDYKVLVLDGTWRKTYKMMQLNKALQSLPRINLTPDRQSSYRIRKQKNARSLSTVEAIVELLSQIENDHRKFQPLLDAFDQMQQQQMAFRSQ